MGGGVGMSIHGSHRIATEKLMFAMPEVGIGFFPDVGASWFLPRLPGRTGAYLGLTGARIGLGDALALGLATHAVEHARLPAVAEALRRAMTSTRPWRGSPRRRRPRRCQRAWRRSRERFRRRRSGLWPRP